MHVFRRFLDEKKISVDLGRLRKVIWHYKKIVGYQGPLKLGDKDYNGSNYNVLLEWETGEVTAEPLNIIASNDPVTCAIYAQEKGLLDQPR